MITKEEIQQLLHTTETYRVERTISTGEDARPENFPTTNDYRNPLIASAMKTLGYVNMFNRGIGQVQTDLKENGNPPAEFDVNLITAFRVDVKIVEKTTGMKEKVATSNAKVATMKKKISAEEMTIYILEFCNTWRSMDEIAQFADRDKNYIRNKVLPRLADKLEKEHPDSPNHPRQKYRAKKKGNPKDEGEEPCRQALRTLAERAHPRL